MAILASLFLMIGIFIWSMKELIIKKRIAEHKPLDRSDINWYMATSFISAIFIESSLISALFFIKYG